MRATHTMRMIRAEASGTEEWACPICGRRMLLQWPPHYSKQILDPGDESATHIGSSTDLPGEEPAPGTPPCDTPRRWLRETGVDPAAPV
ncbi:hypothetical protein [Actinomadura verrucosospora]|uniref:Uncharacterized protein n=1 Tax=Actinomadura verrucosospora TaxID=46165 RepID=A0A7D3ZV76_ACTVE|nr:hypothetical protein [Actinomadura verrucosospora]QKG19304.1 hypothetical protein ACTIVE_0940 [Actinomadura verrucosospora]